MLEVQTTAAVLATPCTKHNDAAVDEHKIKVVVNKHIELGLKEAGYSYFNVDGTFLDPISW